MEEKAALDLWKHFPDDFNDSITHFSLYGINIDYIFGYSRSQNDQRRLSRGYVQL